VGEAKLEAWVTTKSTKPDAQVPRLMCANCSDFKSGWAGEARDPNVRLEKTRISVKKERIREGQAATRR